MKFLNKLGELILRALDPTDSVSVKRVALLLSIVYFATASFGIFAIGTVLSFIKGKGDIAVMQLYAQQTSLIIKYNFWIVASLIGAISADDIGKAVVENSKFTLPNINVSGDATPTIVQNAETVSAENADTVNAQNVDTVNTSNVTEKN